MKQSVEMSYFVEVGDQLAILRNCVLEANKQHRARMRDLAKAYGADVVVKRGHRPIGLAWHVPAGTVPENRPGLSAYCQEEGESPGFVYHGYVPNKRFGFGRALAKELAKYARAPSPSEQIVKALGASRWVRGPSDRSSTGMAFFVSVAGIAKDKIVLKVPVSVDEPFELPFGMRQVKHSEFIALTEE